MFLVFIKDKDDFLEILLYDRNQIDHIIGGYADGFEVFIEVLSANNSHFLVFMKNILPN